MASHRFGIGCMVSASRRSQRLYLVRYAPRSSWGAAPLHAVNTPLLAQVLLGSGAAVHAPDAHGATALHTAAAEGHAAAVRALIDGGAAVDAAGAPRRAHSGETARSWARLSQAG